MAKHTVEITDSNFEELVLKADKPVLVDFWAEWCGPCIALGPTIEKLGEEYDGRVVVGKLNVDQNANAAMTYGIRSIPAVLLFHNGQVVDKQIGNAPKPAFDRMLQAVVA